MITWRLFTYILIKCFKIPLIPFQGDSGGALCAVRDNDLRQFEAIGIVSWGYDLEDDIPGVYTRVSVHRDWVTGEIDTFYDNK